MNKELLEYKQRIFDKFPITYFLLYGKELGLLKYHKTIIEKANWINDKMTDSIGYLSNPNVAEEIEYLLFREIGIQEW
jgi:hypothetical protein